MNTTKPKDPKDYKLNSEHHTLFKKQIAAKEEVVDQENNIVKKIPAYTNFRVFIDRFMERERGLHEMFNELLDAKEFDNLELRINSGGGLINEGMQFHTIIKNKFYGRTTTVLDSYGYSMGALLFCMGDKRIITPNSDLMFHDYSSMMLGKGGELRSRMKHKDLHIKNFFESIILENNYLSQEEYNSMLIGKDFWFNAKQLCKRKIATHVIVGGKELTAKQYLKSLKKK